MRILVAEQSGRLAGILRKRYAGGFCRIVSACGGADALRQVHNGGLDLVIVDDVPPGADGMEMVRAVRAAGGTVPFLLLGAPEDEGDIVAALCAGVTDYLSCPFAISELIARIRALLGWRLPEPAAEKGGERIFVAAPSATADEYGPGNPERECSVPVPKEGRDADDLRAHVEQAILALLLSPDYRDDVFIDLTRLQHDCQRQGYSRQEFSYGFVRLLSRHLLVPCGEFAYCLAEEGRAMELQGG